MNENPAPGSTSGFYTWIDSLHTVRSPQRWMGGVVAGLADRIGMDRTLGRALFVVLTLLTSGLTVLFYGLAWMFLPEPDGRVHSREAGQGRWTAGMTGALVFTVLGIGNLFNWPGSLGRSDGFWSFGSVIGLGIIGFFVWLVLSKNGERGRPRELPSGTDPAAGSEPSQSGNVLGAYSESQPTDQPGAQTGAQTTEPLYVAPTDTGWYSTPAASSAYTAPRSSEGPEPMSATASYPHQPNYRGADQIPPVDRTPPSLSGATQLVVVGLAVLAGAAVSLLRYLDVFTASWPVIWAASLATVLAVMAIGVIAGAIAGRGGGGLTVTTAILAIPVVGATASAYVQDGPWGTNWTDTGNWDGGVVTGNVTEGYDLSFGEGTIDLRQLTGASAAEATPVDVSLSFSTADLVVPNNVDVFLDADSSFGSVNAPSVGTDDAGRLQVVDAPGDEQIVVEADVSFSTLNVRAEAPTTTSTTQN
ncbi:PspC domain-containing protein [Citricoccus nitrophenolicus]|uniref:Phage shock protein C (PspC) family protein n=1 Tax=Citricoccus muralis TaxID=169134 RepID=A0A3D9LDE3_9MICC|nr:PspC domain-containing protein [Citricoccus muralis]REE03890.1 phage shock protein C (PspC) family protein [Citricoccus muralis]